MLILEKKNVNHRRIQNYGNWAVKVLLKKKEASIILVVARALQGQAGRRHHNTDPPRTGMKVYSVSGEKVTITVLCARKPNGTGSQ